MPLGAEEAREGRFGTLVPESFAWSGSQFTSVWLGRETGLGAHGRQDLTGNQDRKSKMKAGGEQYRQEAKGAGKGQSPAGGSCQPTAQQTEARVGAAVLARHSFFLSLDKR